MVFKPNDPLISALGLRGLYSGFARVSGMGPSGRLRYRFIVYFGMVRFSVFYIIVGVRYFP